MIIYCFLRAAWQKLGNLNPEIAMEKYMNLLSETIPEWMRSETLVIYYYMLPLKCRLWFPYTYFLLL